MKALFLTCALSLSCAAGWNPPLTHSDKAFHRFIANLTPSETMNDVLFIPKPWVWNEVVHDLINLSPGGFVFIEGRLFELMPWFRDHRWERLPFMWRNFHIFRKPGGRYVPKTSTQIQLRTTRTWSSA